MSPPADDFNAIRDWVDQLLNSRWLVVSHLLSLEPFAPFDTARAADVLHLADTVIMAAADAVGGGSPLAVPAQGLRDAAKRWVALKAVPDGTEPLRAAFAMPDVLSSPDACCASGVDGPVKRQGCEYAGDDRGSPTAELTNTTADAHAAPLAQSRRSQSSTQRGRAMSTWLGDQGAAHRLRQRPTRQI